MKANELLRLAADASGGGVTYTVMFEYKSEGRGVAEMTVSRWDAVNSEYTVYNDASYLRMKDTSLSPRYRPFRESFKVMRDDEAALNGDALGGEPKLTQSAVNTRMAIIRFIRAYRHAHGVSPTRGEIAAAADVNSASRLDLLLGDMRAAGLINYEFGVSRSITVNELGVEAWQDGLQV